MYYTFKITYQGPVGRVLRAKFPGIRKRAWLAVGRHWHRTMRPKHFTKVGAAEYDYTPRSGEPGSPTAGKFWKSYTGRKQRIMGHTRPLAWSGASQTLTRIENIRATSKGVRIIMNAPTLNFPRRRGGKTMRQEMTTVSNREVSELMDLFSRTLQQGINAVTDVVVNDMHRFRGI